MGHFPRSTRRGVRFCVLSSGGGTLVTPIVRLTRKNLPASGRNIGGFDG